MSVSLRFGDMRITFRITRVDVQRKRTMEKRAETVQKSVITEKRNALYITVYYSKMRSYTESEDALNTNLYMFVFLIFTVLFIKAILS